MPEAVQVATARNLTGTTNGVLRRAETPREHRERAQRIHSIAREQHHRVEPEVRDPRDEILAGGGREQPLDRLLADLPRNVLARPAELPRDERLPRIRPGALANR